MKTNLRKATKDFMLGTDPELLLSHGGQPAKFFGQAHGKFGLDGNGRTCELRVDPSANPLELVSQIHTLFKDYAKKYPVSLKFNWDAGSFVHGFPIGGHVHFGVSKFNLDHATASEVISNYCGALSLCIEDTKEAKSRRQIKEYGGYHDFRPQAHGFEHRSFSSWLTSPAVASAVLCLCKTVMFEMLNNKAFSPTQYFDANTFHKVEKQDIKKKFPYVWKEITEMQLYPRYKKHIDVIHFLITKDLSWYPKNSLKEVWGLTEFAVKEERKMISLDEIWKTNNKNEHNF